jgi:hypothetical protein
MCRDLVGQHNGIDSLVDLVARADETTRCIAFRSMANCCAQNKTNQERLGNTAGLHALAECLSGKESELTKVEVVRLAGYVASRSSCRRKMGQCSEGKKLVTGLLRFLCSENSKESKSLALRSLCFCVTNTRQEKSLANRSIVCENGGLQHILPLLSNDSDESLQRDAIKTIGQCFAEHHLQITHTEELQKFCNILVKLVDSPTSSQKLLLTITAVLRQCVEVNDSLVKGILAKDLHIFPALQSVLLKASDFNIKMQTACILYECARSMEPTVAEQKIPAVSILQVLLHTLQYEIQKDSNRKKDRLETEKTAKTLTHGGVYLDLYVDIVKEKTLLQVKFDSLQKKMDALQREVCVLQKDVTVSTGTSLARSNYRHKTMHDVDRKQNFTARVTAGDAAEHRATMTSEYDGNTKVKPKEDNVVPTTATAGPVRETTTHSINISNKLCLAEIIARKPKQYSSLDHHHQAQLNPAGDSTYNAGDSEECVDSNAQFGTKPGEEAPEIETILYVHGSDSNPVKGSPGVTYKYEKEFELKSRTPLPIPGRHDQRQAQPVENCVQLQPESLQDPEIDSSHLEKGPDREDMVMNGEVLLAADSFIYRMGFSTAPIGFPVGPNSPTGTKIAPQAQSQRMSTSSTYQSQSQDHLAIPPVSLASQRLFTHHHRSEQHLDEHHRYHKRHHVSKNVSSICLAYRHFDPRPVGIAVVVERIRSFDSARHNQTTSDLKKR